MSSVETKYATIDRDELKRLQKDAERYRLLRNGESAKTGIEVMDCTGPYEELWPSLSGTELDSAIDANLLAAQGERHE